MSFTTLDHQVGNLLFHGCTVKEKYIKERCFLWELLAKTLQKSGAVGGSSRFEQDVSSCDNSSASCGGVGNIHLYIVLGKLVDGELVASPLAGEFCSKANTDTKDNLGRGC
jgi:hypothetical protein